VKANAPQDLHQLFETAFNATDIDGLMVLYEADCAIVPAPGTVAQGPEQVREALQSLLALNGTARLITADVVTVGDLALMSCRWTLRGAGPDGAPLAIGGVTAEIARRQPDGAWLYVIDNPVADQTIAAA
jgi:ketosteroid isomerase-like protein